MRRGVWDAPQTILLKLHKPLADSPGKTAQNLCVQVPRSSSAHAAKMLSFSPGSSGLS